MACTVAQLPEHIVGVRGKVGGMCPKSSGGKYQKEKKKEKRGRGKERKGNS